MAMSEAAMPPEPARKSRRLTPSFFAASSAISLIRASTCFCFSLCGFGRYSPLETFWVGIGEQNSSDSTSKAREHLVSSSGDIQVLSDTEHPPRFHDDGNGISEIKNGHYRRRETLSGAVTSCRKRIGSPACRRDDGTLHRAS